MTCNTFPEKRPKRFRLLFASVLYSKVGNECKKYKCIQEWVEGQNFDSMQQAYVVVGLCLAELLTIISPFLSRIVVEKHVGYYCANTVFLFAYFIASLKVFHCVELTPFTTPLSYRIHLVNCNIWTVVVHLYCCKIRFKKSKGLQQQRNLVMNGKKLLF